MAVGEVAAHAWWAGRLIGPGAALRHCCRRRVLPTPAAGEGQTFPRVDSFKGSYTYRWVAVQVYTLGNTGV